jgi:HAD superfamily hydrolase (TIGR01490 family)
MSNLKKIGAFFDLDYVIVGKDLYRLIGEELIRKNMVSKFRFILWYFWLIKYRFNLLKAEDVLKNNIKDMGGMDLEKFGELAQSVYERALKYILPGAVKLIEEHKRSGHQIAILSANFKILIEPIAKFLGIENVIAIELEVKDGKFTGKVVEPMCIGRGKTFWMRKFAREKNIDLTESFFYTDSFYDFDTLLSVGNPVAVNPDPKLKKFAKKLGWKIIYTK